MSTFTQTSSIKNFLKLSLCAIFLVAFLPNEILAQNFNVQYTLPMDPEDRLSVCGDSRVHEIRLENISGADLTDVVLDLNLPTGVFYVPSTLTGGTAITDDPPQFDLGDFKDGGVLTITYELDVNCDGIGLAVGASDILYDFDLTYTGGAGSQTGNNSPKFEVVKPTLSFPNVTGNASGSNVYDADLGAIDTLKVDVVNGNNGALREFTYCVQNDHPNVTINDILVGGVSIPLAYTSPSGDRAYFIIDQDDINTAVAQNPAVDDPDLFQFNETIVVCEVWETTSCPAPASPDLQRTAFYGCDGTDNCEETPPSFTGVRFGFLKPTLYANDYYHAFNSTVPMRDRPWYSDCYRNPAEPLYFEYAFVNTGPATLKLQEFVIELHALGYQYIPWDIDVNGIEVYFKDGATLTPVPGVTVDSIIANTNSSYITNCHDGDPSVRKVAHNDECILIPTGDTLIYKLPFFYDNADCGDCSNTYDQFNWPYLQAEEVVYSDQCAVTVFSDVNGNVMPRLRQYQRTLAEGASNAFEGVPLTTCFQFTAGENYFFTYACPNNGQPNSGASYDSDTYHINSPNAWNEIWYIIPEGLDWAGTDGDLNTTEACFTDAQGDIYPIYEVDYVDNGGGADTVKVRYQQSGDVCFDFLSNPKYKVNTVVDCDEGPPFCDKTVNISMEAHYVTECGDDGTQCFEAIDAPRNWSVTIQNCYCAPCEGIVFTYIDISRQTFGLGDADNDGIVDGDPLDESLINKLRFTTGDTIKATYGGWINLIDDFGYPEDFFEYAYGAVNIPVVGTWGDEGISPLKAEFTVWDASNGNAQYTCDLVQMFPDGQKVVANISTQSLIDLGCSGMPADFVYEQDDSLSLCIYFRVKDWDDATQTINFGSEFYASDAPYDEGTKYQCNTLNQSLNYVGYTGYNDWVYRDVAGCNDGKDNTSIGTPSNGVTASDVHRTRVQLGTGGFDEFPFEIRQVAVPTTQTFVNNSDLMWGNDFSMSLLDPNGHLSPTGGYLAWQNYRVDMASSPCFAVTATTVTVDYDCLMAQVGYERFDEGLYLYATPDLSPSCNSEYEAPFTYKDVDAFTNWDVDESIFCNPVINMVDTVAAQNDGVLEEWNRNQDPNWIINDNSINGFDYVYLSSLPSIELMPITFNNLLLSEEACFEVTVENRGDATASNSFFTFESPSGGVVFQSVMDAATGTSLMSNVGVVELGQMAPGDFRTLEICVTSNNCERDSIVVNSGWDCSGYPGSASEIECSVPETLYLDIPEAELGMVVLSPDPLNDHFIDLCSEVEYVVQLSSADVGALHDINFLYSVPTGHTMVPGSFDILYPVGGGTWTPSPTQPTQLGGPTGTVFQLLIDPNDPIISQAGLVGTTDLTMNFMQVRFKTYVGCGANSGSRARFLSWAYNPCDELANYRFSPGPRIKINGVSDPYISSLVIPNPAVLNACEGNTIPVGIEFDLEVGSQPIGPADSLMVELPAGIMFSPGSYTPISNAAPASATNPVVQTQGTGQLVIFDLLDGTTAGSTISFTFEIFADDIAQECRGYDLIVSTFNTQMIECAATGEICDVRAISDEVTATVQLVKPDLSIKNVMLNSCAAPPDMETVDYCLEIMNMGAPVAAGVTTNLELYDDTNDNGDIDIGVDVLIGMISTTDAIPSGGTTMICGQTSVPSGMTCNVIAVINPETTCACMFDASFRANSELKIPFDQTDWEICSDELIPSVGPEPLANVTYEWVGINGANTTAFGDNMTTPTSFQFRNTTGTTIVWEYYLRSVRNDDCATLDTISITIFPEEHGEVSLQACPFDSFNLSGPTGNTNYQWSPQAGLTDPFSSMTDVDASLYPPGTHTFTLTYTDVNGCPGDYTVEATIVPCALTYVGNYVWCDENNNGLQDDGAPIEGVTVNLYSSINTTAPIASAVTDANGFYLFGPIPQAEYIIGLDVPSNYQVAMQDVGADDELDSDIGPGFLTAPFFLSNGDSLTTIDAGVLCPLLDLELEKDVFADMSETPLGAVSLGDVVWWKVEVCNRTMDPDTVNFDALGVVVADTLPLGVTYVSSAATQGAYDETTGLWDIGEIENGTCDVLWIESIITLDVLPITNVAQISAADDPDIDSDPNNDDGDQSEDDEDPATIGGGADLRLTKVVDNDMPQQNDIVTFTIAVTNDGPLVATNVVVSDTIPACLTYTSTDGGSTGTVDDTNAPTIDWSIPQINVNETVYLEVSGTANTLGECCNYAQVTASDQPDVDSEPNNDDGDQSEDDEDKDNFTILPDCEMAITSIVVGDCNPLTNEYEVTVNVTYGNLAPATTTISLNNNVFALDYSGAQSFTLTGLTADGAMNTITAFMVGDTGCGDTDDYTAPNVCIPFDCTAMPTHVTCAGGSDGQATANPLGGTSPFSYVWSPGGATTQTITGLTIGTYSVTITDDNGTTSMCSAIVEEPTAVTCSVNLENNISCNGLSDGSATVAPVGGTPAYTYLWSTGETTATAEALVVGLNTVTVTDNSGCTGTCTITITQPDAMVCNTTYIAPTCPNSDDAEVTVLATGGTTPYEYSLDGGAWQPGNVITDVAAGMHTVTVRDANLCLTTCDVNVVAPGSFTCDAVEISPATCGLSNGSASSIPAGGTSPYTSEWDNGETTMTALALSAGMHAVTVTDDNGCTTECSVSIMTATGLGCTMTFNSDISCFGADDGNATVNVTGGTTPYSYAWSNGETTATAAALVPGSNTVVVTDADGCTTECMVDIEEPTLLACQMQKNNDISCFGADDGGATVSAEGGTAPYMYAWGPSGETTATATALEPGINTVTVTDFNGCTTTCTVDIAEPAELTCSLTSTPSACMGQDDGTVTVTTTGGITPLAYSINGGPTQTGALFEDLAAGNYTVLVTDDNGCTTECSIEVEITGCEFDLALIKQLTPGQVNPVNPGDPVSFTITVFNQGQIPADNIVVTDYVPTGLTYNPTNTTNVTNGWMLASPNIETTLTVVGGQLPAGGLAPGASTQVVLILDVAHNAPQGSTLTNFAEISDATDDNGDPVTDVDSDPDNDPGNDGPADDDTTDGTNDDEDDHDPEDIQINYFDLALTKTLATGQSTTVAPGDPVDFTITVYNQGTIAADNIEITDYIPTCMENIDADWSGPAAGPVVYTMSVAGGDLPAGGLAPGAFAQVDISLQVLGSADMTCDLTNWAEISDDTDADGDPIDDQDSTTDGDQTNDTYGGDDETDNLNGDEDDHDPAGVELLMADLALAKDLGTGENSSVAVGQDVTFTITIENQGSIPADNINVADYLDPCMTLNDSDWTGTNPAYYLMTVANGDLPAGGLLPGQQATVDITVTITCAPATGQLVNVAEIESFTDEDGNPLEDNDSTPDDDPDNDPPGEDDIDDEPLNILEFDLALSKELATGQTTQVAPGDLITYTISVINQGQINADNIEITDYIPTCMTLADANWTQVGAYAEYTLTVANGDLPVGGLAPMQTASVNLTLQLDNPVASTCDLTNVAEISDATDDDGNPQDDSDSDPDDNPDNDPPGEDDIDDVPVELEEFDLALSKDLAVGQSTQVAPGDLITYTITVINQGQINADNIEVIDYMPSCMTLADANWSQVGAYASYTMSVANGDLPVGGLAPMQTASVNITLQLANPVPPTCDLTNAAEIGSATDEDGDPVDDVDSDPDDDPDNDPPGEDDNDEVPVELLEFDLALTKDLADGQPSAVAPGDLITYDISVINQGDINADNIEIVDYIPSCMSLADANWTLANGNAYYTMTVANGDLPAGGLAPMQTASVQITLELDNPIPVGCDTNNWSEIAGATDEDGDPQEDSDSDPDDDDSNDPPGEDDIDDQDIDILDFDLALTKSLAVGQTAQVMVGDDVTYTFTVTNQGQITADNIEVTDYIPADFVLNDPDWTAGVPPTTASILLSAANGGLPAGGLLPGQMVMVDITLMIQMTALEGNTYVNVGEISEATDEDGMPQDDIDSDPDDDPNNDPPGEDDIDDEPVVIMGNCDLAQIKTFNHFYSNGDGTGGQVVFDINVINQGSCDAYEVGLIDYILPGWTLNDPDWYESPFDGNAYYTIAGPILPGETVVVPITFDVTFFDPLDPQTNWSEITGSEDFNGDDQEDMDSDPDDNPNNDGPPTDNEVDGANSDEDDHDFEDIQIIDLAIDKSLDPSMMPPYAYGDDIIFNICVTNEGNATVNAVTVADYIPAGFTFDPALNPTWTNTAPTVFHTFDGPIVQNDVVCENIVLQFTDAGSTIEDYTNVTEITEVIDEDGNPNDDDWDSTPDNDDGDQSEDDEDAEVFQVFDLELEKIETSSGPYSYGENVTFDIVVCNTGSMVATDIVVEDRFPCGYEFVASDGWSFDGTSVSANIAGPLIPSECETLSLTMVVQACDEAGAWNNVSEITDASDEFGDPVDDIDSDPDNDDPSEDDQDDEEIEVFDLANTKTIAGGNSDPYLFGDIIEYHVTVYNQGNVPATNVTVVDYLPAGLSFDAAYVDNTSADPNANNFWLPNVPLPGDATVRYSRTIAGPIMPGTSMTVSIFLEVVPVTGGDQEDWYNFTEITEAFDDEGNPTEDADSTPDNDPDNDGPWEDNEIDNDNGDEDDHDGEQITVSGDIGDTVWKDLDGDGIQDANEYGVANAIVRLYTCAGTLLETTTTDNNGNYLFEDILPGDYYIEFDIDHLPPGCYFTEQNVGNDNNDSDANFGGVTDCFTTNGTDRFDIDAGLVPCVEVGDFLFYDTNGNNLQDAYENGINGVKVELYRIVNGTAVLFDYQYTGHKPGTPSDDGWFKFCAPPGQYYLEFVVNNSVLIPVVPFAGSNQEYDSNVNGAHGANTTATFNVTAGGAHVCHIDGGYTSAGSSSNGNTQPVAMTSARDVSPLTAVAKKSHNKLNFDAISAEEDAYFMIERSLNGGDFETIGRFLAIEGTDQSDYDANDYNVFDEGLYTYKLSVVTNEDEVILLDELSLRVERAIELGAKIYPNPAVDEFNIEVEITEPHDMRVSIVGPSGQLIEANVIDTRLEAGVNVFKIDISNLSAGFHIVRINVADKVIDKKLIVIGN